MGFLDILKQYSSPGATPSGDVFGHFDAVSQQASPNALGSGIAAALRSGRLGHLGSVGHLGHEVGTTSNHRCKPAFWV